MKGLYYIGKLEEYERVLADRPLDELWNHLLKLADFHYIKPRWKDHSEDEYTEISTCVKQAYEYYTASKDVSLLTKPVLTYYSFLNLTKAIIFLKTDARSSNSHGLGSTVMNESILDVTVTSYDGVFSDLFKLFGGNIKARTIFSLGDLISNTIEIIPAYSEYFLKTTNVVSPEVAVYTTGEIHVTFHPFMLLGKTREQFLEYLSQSTAILEYFEETPNKEHLELKLRNAIPYINLQETGSALMKKLFMFSVFQDMLYYINLNKDEKRIHPAIAYYGIAFMLGSIARYAPNHIDRFVSNKTTSVGWFFRRLLETTERVFPNLMLDVLNGRNHKYASSFSF